MNVRHPWSVLHLFSTKNIFYDKMDLMLFFSCDGLWKQGERLSLTLKQTFRCNSIVE